MRIHEQDFYLFLSMVICNVAAILIPICDLITKWKRKRVERQREMERQRLMELESRRLEAQRREVERRQQEEQRKLEEQRREEERRQLEEQRRLEDQRREEERRQQEEQRRLEDQRREEERRQQEEQRRMVAQLEEERRLLEEERRLEEQRRQKKQRLLEEQRMMETKPELTPLDGFIQLTSSQNHLDMISLEGSPDCVRAIMPCGHVISPESMEDYAWDVLSKGKTTFVCPAYPICSREWPYKVVKHVACLSINRTQEFDLRMSENYIRKDSNTQTCPECFAYIDRGNMIENRVQCPSCLHLNGKMFQFCWACLKEWRNYESLSDCGNPDCDEMLKRIKLLAECPTMMICNRVCPSVRGCPNCGTLIEFIEACNQMQCRACKQYFCFLCLHHSSPTPDTICISYRSQCQVAERQTTLPKKHT